MSHSSHEQSPSNDTDYPIHLSNSTFNNTQHGYCIPSPIQTNCMFPSDLDASSHVDDPNLLLSPDKDSCDGEESKTLSSSSCIPHHPLLCTICVDLASSPADVVTITSCGHSFCLSCLASWFQVRHFCPNCKTMFSDVVVSRDVSTGDILCGPVTEDECPVRSVISLSDLMICPPTWLKIQLTSIHSAKHDIEYSFGMRRTEMQMSYQDLLALQQQFQNQVSVSTVITAPAYEYEEIEDDLEDQYWEEEERAHQRLMRTNRTISNRRYGNSGYLAAGRMHARPMNNNVNSNSGGAGCSSVHAKMKKKKKEMECVHNHTGTTTVRSAEVSNSSNLNQQLDIVQKCMTNTNRQNGEATSGSGVNRHQKTGGRKKKVKKKSRAGIAAAKAAAEKAQEVSCNLTEASKVDRNLPNSPSGALSTNTDNV